jgi:hypothetical protein
MDIVDFARLKIRLPRRAVLWLETVAALREALAKRPQPKRTEEATKGSRKDSSDQ